MNRTTTRTFLSFALVFTIATGFWFAMDAIEFSIQTSGIFAKADITCGGCHRRSEGGSSSGFGSGSFGGFGGGGEIGGGGGTLAPSPVPACTLDLTENNISWTTNNAHTVIITPKTNSPEVPGGSQGSASPAGTVLWGGSFSTFKATYASLFQEDATAHGGAVLGNASFKADKLTADRLCAVAFPGSVNGVFNSDTFSSPGDNTIAKWNGSAWSVVPARGNDPHLRYTFTCVTASDSNALPLSGSHTFNPSLGVGTHTYVLTAKGKGGTKTCEATVTVPPPPPAPGCIRIVKETFDPTGAKLTPVAQFTFKLDGGASVVSDANGHARFDNVSLGTHTVTEVNPGSVWKQIGVTPSQGIVFVEDGPTCAAVVFKNQQVIPPEPGEPSCTLSAEPTTVASGTPSTLTWTTAHAANFSIDHGVGSGLSTTGSAETGPLTVATTFIGTVTNNSGKTASCSATVNVTTPTQNPVCALSVDRSKIRPGESVKISWSSSNVTSGEINGNVGSVSPVSGGTTPDIFPPDSMQYTGTFTGPSGTTSCTVSVEVEKGGGGGCQGNCGGGGLEQPRVSLLRSPSEQPLAFVSLTQVPYTGFEAGPLLTALFWLAVALWSAGIAYLIVGKRGMELVASLFWRGLPASPRTNEVAYAPFDELSERYAEYIASQKHSGIAESSLVGAPSRALATTVIPAPGASLQSETSSLQEAIESHAHQSGVLLSPEAVQAALQLATNHSDILRVFGDVVREALRILPREDGWVLLSSDRLMSIASDLGNVPLQREEKHTAPALLEGDFVNSAAEHIVGAILEKRRDDAFSLLRELEGANVSATQITTEVVQTLDRLYQARLQDSPVENVALREKAERISPEHLHVLVDIFSNALGASYTLPYTGLKIALAQALDVS